MVLALCLFAMWVAGPLMRVIGVTGTNVANRLFGVVLGALAVQFVVDGLRASFAYVDDESGCPNLRALDRHSFPWW